MDFTSSTARYFYHWLNRSWTLGNADEIYNADSTVDKSDIEIIKAEDVL